MTPRYSSATAQIRSVLLNRSAGFYCANPLGSIAEAARSSSLSRCAIPGARQLPLGLDTLDRRMARCAVLGLDKLDRRGARGAGVSDEHDYLRS